MIPMLDKCHSLAKAHGDNEGYELLLNNFWRPTLSVTGFSGLPSLEKAGNVVYQELSIRTSLRLPPTLDQAIAAEAVKAVLTEKRDDETHNAQVEVIIGEGGNGFDSPALP